MRSRWLITIWSTIHVYTKLTISLLTILSKTAYPWGLVISSTSLIHRQGMCRHCVQIEVVCWQEYEPVTHEGYSHRIRQLCSIGLAAPESPRQRFPLPRISPADCIRLPHALSPFYSFSHPKHYLDHLLCVNIPQ